MQRPAWNHTAGRLLFCFLLFAFAWPAAGHPLDDNFVVLTVEESHVSVRWDLSVRDIDAMVPLDADRDGRISEEEVRRRQDDITVYALPHLKIADDSKACVLDGAVAHDILLRGENRYVVLRYRMDCGRPMTRIEASYDLFFDVHPDHRALIAVVAGRTAWNAILTENERTVAAALDGPGKTGFAAFFSTGVLHMLEGIDHLLFLAVLLLPLMLAGDHGWRPRFVEAAKILTAFTLAHGLTLWLAALGLVAVPSRLAESVIALSIAITAVDNVRPFLGRRRWLVAFGFGLVHGLGFASALGPLSLPPLDLAVALLAFNLGLETAQLGVALAALPAGYLISRLRLRSAFLPLGSAAAGIVGLLWFAERAFDLSVFS